MKAILKRPEDLSAIFFLASKHLSNLRVTLVIIGIEFTTGIEFANSMKVFWIICKFTEIRGILN